VPEKRSHAPQLLVKGNADYKYEINDENTISSQGLPEAGEERRREETSSQTSHKGPNFG